MSKFLSVRFSIQERKNIRSMAGSMDKTASGLIRETVKENLEKFTLSKPKD
ncbi:hypothetical protein ES707_16040 [subsurface metagenome]